MYIALLIALVVVPLWLNIKATLLVCKDSLSEKPQKVAQLILVWLLPLFGAMVVLAIHRKQEKTSGTYLAERNPGDDFGVFGSSLKTITEAIDGD